MAAPEFSFALEGRESAISHDMLRDLVSQVFDSAGCAPHAAGALAGLEAALATVASGYDAPLGLTFQAHDGHLHVVLSAEGREIWRTTCPAPG